MNARKTWKTGKMKGIKNPMSTAHSPPQKKKVKMPSRKKERKKGITSQFLLFGGGKKKGTGRSITAQKEIRGKITTLFPFSIQKWGGDGLNKKKPCILSLRERRKIGEKEKEEEAVVHLHKKDKKEGAGHSVAKKKKKKGNIDCASPR